MTQYNHTDIIDLSEGNEFTFLVPFIFIRPWCDIEPMSATSDYSTFGRAFLKVENELRGPDNVPAQI